MLELTGLHKAHSRLHYCVYIYGTGVTITTRMCTYTYTHNTIHTILHKKYTKKT